MLRKYFLSIIVLIVLPGTCFLQEVNKKSVAVTVYNNNLGVVKDVRTIKIPSGQSKISITDVAQFIDPTSVHIKLNGEVIEQNYQYDLVSVDKILQKYIDKNVQLIGKDDKLIEGTLLSSQGGQLVLRKDDGGLVMLPNLQEYRVSVGTLPEGLITKPTLVWLLNSSSSKEQDVEISYQTGGMNWHAEYVAVLNNEDTKLDLKSWVSIENNSGSLYDNAALKLVAGDVNLIQPPQPYIMEDNIMRKNEALSTAGQQFQEKSFFEYHIYNLQRPVTLANNETKQISLFETEGVNVNKKYLYRSGGDYYYPVSNSDGSRKVSVIVEFDNKEKNNMGMPLPKGKVRLYKSDGKTIEFIGEDMIDHTPRDEKIKLKIGDAFDVLAEEKQTDQRRITDRVTENSFEIKLKNRKEEDITVEVEKFLGNDWKILDSSINFEKKDARTVLFKVPVGKNSETVLKFRVRYSY